MPGPGRSHDEMAEVRAARGPCTDPRDGRLCHQIRMAFWVFEGVGNWRPKGTPAKVTTLYLMSYCYPREYHMGQLKSWHRTNTIKAARMVAIPVRSTGKGSGSGRSFIWTPISEEVLNERSWQGKSRRRQARAKT
jgi:hypothetical protein